MVVLSGRALLSASVSPVKKAARKHFAERED